MSLLKRVLALFLLGCLTGCASQASVVPTVGTVASCDSISRSNVATGLVFPCLDGKSALHFSALRGPLIVNVWGSWCAPCKDEVPIIRSFYAKTKSQLQVLGVDVKKPVHQKGLPL